MTVSKKIEPGWKEIVIHGAPTDINLILSNANGVNPTWGTVEIPGDMDSEIKAAYLDVYAWIRTTGSVGNTASVSENQVDVDNDLASGAMKSNTISKTSLPGVNGHGFEVIWRGEVDIKAKATAGRTLTATTTNIKSPNTTMAWIHHAHIAVRMLVK